VVHPLPFALSHNVPFPVETLSLACQLSLSVLLPVALTFSFTIFSVANISFAFSFAFALTLALPLSYIPLLSFSFHVPHHYGFFYPGLFAEGWYILSAAITKTSRRVPSLLPPVFRPHRFWYGCLAFSDGLVV
jgi:hypothetical protein